MGADIFTTNGRCWHADPILRRLSAKHAADDHPPAAVLGLPRRHGFERYVRSRGRVCLTRWRHWILRPLRSRLSANLLRLMLQSPMDMLCQFVVVVDRTRRAAKTSIARVPASRLISIRQPSRRRDPVPSRIQAMAVRASFVHGRELALVVGAPPVG